MSAGPDSPDLSVAVLSWNTRDLTLSCLEALHADPGRRSREIVVVDNASEDGSAEAIAARYPGVRLLRNTHNAGYAAGNNQAAAVARGRWLCLLGSDTEVRPGALDALVDFLEEHPDYAAAAPRLVGPRGDVQRSCMRFPGLLTALCYDNLLGRIPPGSWVQDRYFMRDFDHLRDRDVPQPPGTCLVLAREEYLALGGMDENLWLFFNDVDLCRRLWRKGRRIRYLAAPSVVHHGGASTGRFEGFVVTWFRDRLTYYRKHYGRAAAAYVRFMVRLRALEEWVRLGRRHRDPAARRAARADLRGHLREILAP